MFPTVSVVIPVKDDAAQLECCLEALARQTVPADEIVVVDNASTDLTPEVARWWGVRYLRQESPGIPATASAGYDAARSDVIARLDADSCPAPDWIERIAAAFAADTALDAVTGRGDFDGLNPVAARLARATYMDAYFSVFGRLIGRTPLFGSTFAMTRASWDRARIRVHREDPEVHDDLDLSFCLPPGARVELRDDLQVRISSRPFRDPIAFARRIGRGVHTVAVNRDGLAVARGGGTRH